MRSALSASRLIEGRAGAPPRCARLCGTPVAAACALLVGLASPASRAHAQAPRVVVQMENDAFALGTKTDRWYTGGARLMAFVDDAERGESRVARLGRPLLRLGGDATPDLAGLSLTQLVYTPDDRGPVRDPHDDRPAGAWLALGLFAQRDRGRLSEAAELKLGPVGPAALGRPVQDGVHRALGLSRSGSWDRQVRAFAGIEYGWSVQWRALGAPLPFTLAPHAGLTVGTIRRDAVVGLTLFAGRPPAGLLPGGVEGRTVPVSAPAAAGMPVTLPGGLHGWVDVQWRRAGWQAFIDGDVYGGDAPAIRHRRWVGELSVGVALPLPALPGRPTLALSSTIRGPEFDATPPPASPRQRVGAVTLIFAR